MARVIILLTIQGGNNYGISALDILVGLLGSPTVAASDKKAIASGLNGITTINTAVSNLFN